MIDFKAIQLNDKAWIDPLLAQSNYRGSEYAFSNNYDWKDIFHIQVAQIDGYYVVKSGIDYESYLYPAGAGDIKPVIEQLMADAKERGIPFNIHGITDETKAELELLFPDAFTITEHRNAADYIYAVEKMTTLSGKKLHSKRNHIARFKENNSDWTYESITEKNIDECIQMNSLWCKQMDCNLNKSLRDEACAVRNAFSNFKALGLRGGLLRVDGNVIAYTMGARLNADTLVVHVEKAFAEIQGAYPMINQQFVTNECQDFTYVNREDDLGEEGLRKAKLSYYPEILLNKYEARLKG